MFFIKVKKHVFNIFYSKINVFIIYAKIIYNNTARTLTAVIITLCCQTVLKAEAHNRHTWHILRFIKVFLI